MEQDFDTSLFTGSSYEFIYNFIAFVSIGCIDIKKESYSTCIFYVAPNCFNIG